MIFPHLELESVVQVNDRTRLNASKSYISPGESAISKVEIKPDSTGDYIDVTSSLYLDWQYDTAGDKTVSVKVTTGVDPTINSQEFTKTIKVLTEDEDFLYSDDSDLTAHEPDILKWVSEGRNSFLNIHRQAQARILAWLDEQGYTDFEGHKITKELFVDKSEVQEWSKFLVLQLIFESIHNRVDDVFREKAKSYESDMVASRNRAFLRYDWNKDGEQGDGEKVRFASISLLRR